MPRAAADGPQLLRRVALVLLGVAGAGAIALFAWCVAQRFPYPHELSKMEGGFVDHARRAAAGLPLYAPPSAEFVPFLYMPLAHHVAGWFVRAGLDGFTATRLVSLAGIAGAVALGMFLVARGTGRRALALLVPALVAARYFHVECFYDQARPDDLMAFFCTAAVAALALPSARLAVPLFAVCGTLAFFTKQSAALYLGVLLAGAAFVRFKVVLASGALLLATTVPIFQWMNHATEGRLEDYTFGIAASHTLDQAGFLALVRSEFLNHFVVTTVALAVLVLASVRAVVVRPRGRTLAQERVIARLQDPRTLARHLVVCGALAAAAFSLASSTQKLAVRNVYVPFAIAAAAFLPVAFDVLDSWLRHTTTERRRVLVTGFAALLLAADIARGIRDPRPWTPKSADVATWRGLLDACAKLGPRERTWPMLHGAAWGGRAGDPFHAHFGAITDLVGGYFGAKTGNDVPADLRERIETRWYTSILVGDWDRRARELIGSHYVRDESIEPVRLPMFSGYKARFTEVWVPKPVP